MKNIYSNIYSFNKKVLEKTVKSLKVGNLAALPTETVYGLAGNAYLKRAVKKIYKIKKRPKINPLIIHYYNFKDAEKDVIFNQNFLNYIKILSRSNFICFKKKKKNKNYSFSYCLFKYSCDKIS